MHPDINLAKMHAQGFKDGCQHGRVGQKVSTADFRDQK